MLPDVFDLTDDRCVDVVDLGPAADLGMVSVVTQLAVGAVRQKLKILRKIELYRLDLNKCI